MTSRTDSIQVDVDSGVGWLTLNQPERHNAISRDMWLGIAEAVDRFQRSDAVRVVVLRGAGGKAFAAGADITEFDALNATAKQSAEYRAPHDRGMDVLYKLDKPVIAMIQGYCIGAGLAMALTADVRFATPGSRFAIPAAKLGLGYDYEGIATLARLVGPSVARDVLFSGRQLDATEALAVGLINVVESDDRLLARTQAYAELIARNAPLTIKASKAAIRLYEQTSQSGATPEVERLIAQCYDSRDYAEGRKAFAEKRRPQFEGR
jgi:enoyl-CoA hydratase/carnithine racemase